MKSLQNNLHFMESIKKIFILATVLFFVSCSTDDGSFESMSNKVVGKIVNNEVMLTADKQDILGRFEKLALSHGVEVEYTHFEIRKLEDDNYAMFAFSKDYLVKSAVSLDLQGVNLKINNNLTLSKGSITCTTKGCSSDSGCTPIQKPTEIDPNVKYWTCTPCSADCTKSTSVQL